MRMVSERGEAVEWVAAESPGRVFPSSSVLAGVGPALLLSPVGVDLKLLFPSSSTSRRFDRRLIFPISTRLPFTAHWLALLSSILMV